MQQVITRIAPRTFRSEWVGVPNSTLKLSFDPLIRHFDLTGNFCLLHWQAKPKNFRRWGVYDSGGDQYFSLPADQITFEPGLRVQTLEISERIHGTVPVAVVWIDGAVFDGKTVLRVN